jgi:hypothetical protein
MDTHSRIITELSAVERNLDLVLFRRYDDDDEGIGVGGYAAGGVAAGGAGLGAYGLIKRGQRVNQTYASPDFGKLGIDQIGAESSAAGQYSAGTPGGRARTVMPERRFVMNPGAPVTVPSTKGVFGDLSAGAKSVGGDISAAAKRAYESPLGLHARGIGAEVCPLKKLLGQGAKAVA